jgi:hypothetical protein
VKHRLKEESPMSDVEKLIEEMRVRGWMQPAIETINEALTMLGGGGPEQDASRQLLENLIAAAEYWDGAQRQAFEDYLKVKAAGWPDEFPSSQPGGV